MVSPRRNSLELNQTERGVAKMRFMSMVKSTERMSGPPPKALMEAIDNLAQEAAKDGCVMVQAGGLLPTSSGMSVRLSGGKLIVTDGRFAEGNGVIGCLAILSATVNT